VEVVRSSEPDSMNMEVKRYFKKLKWSRRNIAKSYKSSTTDKAYATIVARSQEKFDTKA